jgi:hypothetical protein
MLIAHVTKIVHADCKGEAYGPSTTGIMGGAGNIRAYIAITISARQPGLLNPRHLRYRHWCHLHRQPNMHRMQPILFSVLHRVVTQAFKQSSNQSTCIHGTILHSTQGNGSTADTVSQVFCLNDGSSKNTARHTVSFASIFSFRFYAVVTNQASGGCTLRAITFRPTCAKCLAIFCHHTGSIGTADYSAWGEPRAFITATSGYRHTLVVALRPRQIHTFLGRAAISHSTTK